MDLPIGQAIKDVRNHRGFSQSQLAKVMGCKRTYISKVENRKTSLQMLSFYRLSIALNIEPWKLLRYAQKLRKEQEAA